MIQFYIYSFRFYCRLLQDIEYSCMCYTAGPCWSSIFFFNFFNWRIMALQYFVVFCHTSTRISHRYTHVPSHPNLPPISHPTPVLLPGKSHGQRSLVGYSPWGRQELDMTEQLHFHFSLSYIGEGNGTPLQYSCLENPRDRGAWWAAVYGVTQSRTRPKRLSSSSM